MSAAVSEAEWRMMKSGCVSRGQWGRGCTRWEGTWKQGLIGWWGECVDWLMTSSDLGITLYPGWLFNSLSHQRERPHRHWLSTLNSPLTPRRLPTPPPLSLPFSQILPHLPEELGMDRWVEHTVSVRFCSAARWSRERQTYIPLMPVLNGLSPCLPASLSPSRGAFLSQGQSFIISLPPEIEN